ncbi:MAG: glycosyltransferase family 4 protein [Clostridia bacterium]|nr:glycosyltransferase family 4 protein [Clostridia bacterium]
MKEMKDTHALFVGMYPDAVSPYRNVFFQNLIFAMADAGVRCTVISPVPVTKYRFQTGRIARRLTHHTPGGADVTVYYPRYISASSKQIGSFNTETLSEKLFEDCVLSAVGRLDETFDFVYGHFFLYGGLAAIRVGRQLGIPSFLAYGECDFESQVRQTYGIPKKEQLDGLTGIISVSTKNTNELKELGIVDGVPILTAPNSTDLTLFYPKDPAACRKKLGLPADRFIVGFVGGFIERKGDQRLLEAVNGLEDTYAAFAGRGDVPPSGARVVFCQPLAHEDVSDFLNAIDVFCLPTLSEGSCNAIVEAMACGKPIISSNLPFNDDALDATNAIRIDPTSVAQIRQAIQTLKEDPALREKLSEKALEKSKDFDIMRRADRIFRFIQSCSARD